jgi:succinoglycan biosynthesis transport protein ExoP
MSTQLAPSSGGLTPPALRPDAVEGATDGVMVQRQVQRLAHTLFRYKWLIIAITTASTALGALATRLLKPAYEVQGTIWISGQSSSMPNTGPIRAGELMTSNSWPDLLRSFAVLDTVTRDLRLFVSPAKTEDTELFSSFSIGNRVRTGRYLVDVNAAKNKYTLEDKDGRLLESGRLGDSIGRGVGFRWAPPADQLRRRSSVRFSVATPRDASIVLRSKVRVELPDEGNLLRVSLTGEDAQRATLALNAIIRRFVAAAADLKGRNLVEFSRTLEQQLAYAEGELHSAEMALEGFRVKTITLPSEGTPVSGGLEQTRDPVFAAYFQQKVAYEGLEHDRLALEQTLADIRQGSLDVTALWSVISNDNASQDLRAALTEYSAKQASLRAALQVYTEEHRTVRDLRSAIQRLRETNIPQLAQLLIGELRRREDNLDARLSTASRELQSIPTRTIEEMRLRRNVEVRAALYTTLRNRYEEAKLAEASAIPDVSILDSAAVPLQPTQNRKPQIILVAIVGSLALAIAIALLLDGVDGRFRYPEQVLSELALPIIGAVPTTKTGRRQDATLVAQLVESFRSLRMSISYSLPQNGTPMVCVTSPGPGEGKSLVSANLALAFAEAGYRTALVDGDVRRGELHSTFSTQRSPGLSDVLGGTSSLGEALRPTSHERLMLLPSGKRMKSAPELLTSRVLHHTLLELGRLFDAIIVDSSPLSAGVDPFALAATTGHVVLVLRGEQSDLRLTRAKLELLGRLPTKVLGVVINGVKMQGEYRDYSFSPSELDESDDANSAVEIRTLATLKG